MSGGVRMMRTGPGGSKPPPVLAVWIDGRRWLTATTGIDLLAFPHAGGNPLLLLQLAHELGDLGIRKRREVLHSLHLRSFR